MLNWNDIGQKVVGGTLGAIFLIVCIGLFTYTTTRAGTAEVEALAKQHAEDIKESKAADVALKETINSIDIKFGKIVVVLDRMDKQAGGPGMPTESLRRSP